MSVKHLLITGASGYLGRAFLACVKPADFSKVTGVLRDGAVAPELDGISWITYSDLMNDPDSLTDVDIICHLAVPRGGDNRSDLVNYVDDLRCLLKKASSSDVSGFILASSQAVYGATEPPWREDTPLAPMTPWAWAKLAGEQLVRSIQETKPPMRCISLRIPKLVGPGARFRMDQGEYVHSLAFSALRQRKIRLSSSFLTQKFDFMDVRDAAVVLRYVLKQDSLTWPGVLNIGTGQIVDGKGLLGAVNDCSLKNYGKPLIIQPPLNGAQARDFGMSVGRLHKYFGGYSPRALSETVSDVFSFLNGSFESKF